MRRALLPQVLVLCWSCSDGKALPVAPDRGLPVGPACIEPDDCASGQMCLHGRCVSTPSTAQPAEPLARLTATPGTLSFGSLAAGAERRLAVVLTNEGEAMLTVKGAAIGGGPFRLETLGAGPFWIRPGRSRDVFVTYTGTPGGPHESSLTIDTEAPAVSVSLRAD